MSQQRPVDFDPYPFGPPSSDPEAPVPAPSSTVARPPAWAGNPPPAPTGKPSRRSLIAVAVAGIGVVAVAGAFNGYVGQGQSEGGPWALPEPVESTVAATEQLRFGPDGVFWLDVPEGWSVASASEATITLAKDGHRFISHSFSASESATGAGEAERLSQRYFSQLLKRTAQQRDDTSTAQVASGRYRSRGEVDGAPARTDAKAAIRADDRQGIAVLVLTLDPVDPELFVTLEQLADQVLGQL